MAGDIREQRLEYRVGVDRAWCARERSKQEAGVHERESEETERKHGKLAHFLWKE